jgi:uncharacterized protein YkwD
MPECVVCGAESSVTAACPHCAAPVCADHRDPSNHGCRGVDADHTRGWILDLDGSASGGDRGAGEATAGWRDLLRPSRSGARLAVATLLLLSGAVLAVVVAGPMDDAPGGAVVASADGEGPDRPNETRIERLVAERANAERRERGLDPLAYDRTLARVGGAHSGDMRERGFVGHENPDGEGLRERYAAFGLDCPGGENVYHSPTGGLARSPEALAEHVVAAWMDSEGHREAILKERFTRQGVGVAVGPDGGVWVTQDFC